MYDHKERPMPFWVVTFASRGTAEYAVREVNRKKKCVISLTERAVLIDLAVSGLILVAGPFGRSLKTNMQPCL